MNIQVATIFNGKSNDKRLFGVGFAVHKSLLPTVKDFKDVKPRISVLIFLARLFDNSFVNLHAPTEDKQQQYKYLIFTKM